MMPPSRQDVRALFRGCVDCCPWWCTVAATLAVELPVYPHPSSTDSLWRGCRATLQTPPISSYTPLHCCCCCCCCDCILPFKRPSELPLLTFNLGCPLFPPVSCFSAALFCCACSAALCSASAANSAAGILFSSA